jgi:hypothetical protein
MFRCIVCVPWARTFLFARAEISFWVIKSGILLSHCFLFEKCPPSHGDDPLLLHALLSAPLSHCAPRTAQYYTNLGEFGLKYKHTHTKSAEGNFSITRCFLLRLINLCLIFGLFPWNRRARLFFAPEIFAVYNTGARLLLVCIVTQYGGIMLQIMAAKGKKTAYNEERPRLVTFRAPRSSKEHSARAVFHLDARRRRREILGQKVAPRQKGTT